MHEQKYILEEDSEHLYLNYDLKWSGGYDMNDLKKDIKYVLPIGAILYILLWASRFLYILHIGAQNHPDANMDVISILVIIFAVVFLLVSIPLVYLLLTRFWGIFKRLKLYQKRKLHPKLYCSVRDGRIVQRNTEHTVKDPEKDFDLSAEEVLSVTVAEPIYGESYYQIKLSVDKKEYKLDLYFEEDELEELNILVKKIKDYLYYNDGL